MERLPTCEDEFENEIKYVQDTLYVISGKWKLPIILSLSRGNRRYREIARSIPSITFRMLSKELKELEMNKLVSRTVHADSTLLVEYAITEYCQTLTPILFEMITWGRLHRKVI